MGSVIYNSKCTRKRLSVGVRPDPLDDSGTRNAVRDLLAKRRPEKGKEIEGEKERGKGKGRMEKGQDPIPARLFPTSSSSPVHHWVRSSN